MLASDPKRQEILDAIAALEARLDELEQERLRVWERIRNLFDELGALPLANLPERVVAAARSGLARDDTAPPPLAVLSDRPGTSADGDLAGSDTAPPPLAVSSYRPGAPSACSPASGAVDVPPLAESLGRPGASATCSLASADLEALSRVVSLDRPGASAACSLASADLEVPPRAARRVPSSGLTPDEKIALFRSLFRGRTDVYPKLWESQKTDKKGYSPVCAREWAHGVCQKPKVKCGECTQRAFVPVSDAIVRRHLELDGKLVMGVYPLLEGDTCWFVAADFDKASWMDDVAAFRETCRAFDVPVTVERSRSGNGGHAWIFFAEPVLAAVARKIASFILTETMSRRHEISMDSYDRLFPNQDTMPRGGFGNLIALPLQAEARADGNTLFLDDSFLPYPNPWVYLLSVHRMTLAEVDRVAREASRRGDVTGVRTVDADEDEAKPAPWVRRPSPQPLRLTCAVPSELRAVLANRLFIQEAGLPSPLLAEIKRLAAFQNPEFYKKQRLRMSTNRTPRIICCAESDSGYLSLPRGCVADLEKLLERNGSRLILEDKREEGAPLSVHFAGKLNELQEPAADAMMATETGVLVGPPGMGKTVLGTWLIAARARSTLVLVHRQPLLDQWIAELSEFLGLAPKEIGRIGAGRRKLTGRIDVAMIQSLARNGEVDEVVGTYGHVIVDECHHVPAVSFERVLSAVRARYVTGLTATPRRRDGLQPIAHMHLGPVRYVARESDNAGQPSFERRLIIRETPFREEVPPELPIQDLYARLVEHEARNQAIIADVREALASGRSPIILTERREHLRIFAEQLAGAVQHLVVMQGGTGVKARRELVARLAAIPDDEPRLLLATGR